MTGHVIGADHSSTYYLRRITPEIMLQSHTKLPIGADHSSTNYLRRMGNFVCDCSKLDEVRVDT